MRIQLRLNEVGLGRMSVMFRSTGKVSDALKTLELTEPMLRTIRTAAVKAIRRLRLWGYMPLKNCGVSRNVETCVVVCVCMKWRIRKTGQ